MKAALLRANARLLNDGAVLLAGVDPALFADGGSRGGSIGAHLRHCLDFYDVFLAGLRSGRIDYDVRARDVRTETDRTFALARMGRTEAQLRALDAGTLPGRLSVRVGGEVEGEGLWAESSPERELDVLMSHTVHHWALIAAALRHAGHAVPAEFGVAPSTLRARKEADARAG